MIFELLTLECGGVAECGGDELLTLDGLLLFIVQWRHTYIGAMLLERPHAHMD